MEVTRENFRMNYLKRNPEGRGFQIKWDALFNVTEDIVNKREHDINYHEIPVEEFVAEIKKLEGYILKLLRKDGNEAENVRVIGVSNLGFDENGEPSKVKILAIYKTPLGEVSCNSTLIGFKAPSLDWVTELQSDVVRIVDRAFKYIHEGENAQPELYDGDK